MYPYDYSLFDGVYGQRWCQASNTVQYTDPGTLATLQPHLTWISTQCV